MSFESGAAAVASAIIGAGLFGYGLYLRSRLRACRLWPQTTGVVTRSAIDTDDGYQISVIYEYTANGRVYSSSRIRFGSTIAYLRKGSAEAAIRRYPVSSRLPVYYDPEHPAEAVLDRTSPSGLEYIIIGILCLVMMVLVLLYPGHMPTAT